MPIGPGFSYANARIQARHGQRPDEALWRRLEASETVHAYLQLVRSGPLADWVRGLRADDEPQEMEKRLRDAWLEYLERAAGWTPLAWRPAVAWCARLALLPDEARETGESPLPSWREEWHARMPDRDVDELAGVREFERRVAEWMEQNRRPDDLSFTQAEALRADLERQAVRHLRRFARRPAAIFAHLLLSALDMQRLRGGLIRRRVLLAQPG